LRRSTPTMPSCRQIRPLGTEYAPRSQYGWHRKRPMWGQMSLKWRALCSPLSSSRCSCPPADEDGRLLAERQLGCGRDHFASSSLAPCACLLVIFEVTEQLGWARSRCSAMVSCKAFASRTTNLRRSQHEDTTLAQRILTVPRTALENPLENVHY